MIPKRIELENFLSFGKPAVEFIFTDDEPLWVLCGRNGVGKSAVFDGITYALYGEHRGGTQKAEQLVRHSANGFRVVLEFEFASVEYRITRVRAGRTAQKVERRRDGEWEAVAGVNSAADVKAWVEKTLGLGYKAFTTSVLLRQGEADKLFSASRDDRIAVLKGIIGFERFEEISDQVHAATLNRANARDNACRQLSGLNAVTAEELSAAEAAVIVAEMKREQAQAELTAAAQRVEQAKQWEALQLKQAGLEQQLAAARERAEDAVAIRADKARLDDLAIVVPELELLVGLRDHIAKLGPTLTAKEASQDQTAAAIEALTKATEEARHKAEYHKERAGDFDRQAKSLTEKVEQGEKFLQLADAVETLKTRLAAFPADFAEQLVRAEDDENAAAASHQEASNTAAAAEALLQQARVRQARFAAVEVGVTCSSCGQLVTEDHAREEHARLASEIEALEAEVKRKRTIATGLQSTLLTVRKRRETLQKEKAKSDKLSAEFIAKSTNLTQLGGVADAAELRARLTKEQEEKTKAEECAADQRAQHAEAAAAVKRLEVERQKLDSALKKVADAVAQLRTDLATAQGKYDSGFARLARDWQARVPLLDEEAVCQLAVERSQLQKSGVAARFELLRQDEAKREEWLKQLEEARGAIDGIPTDNRIPEQEAERRKENAKKNADQAIEERDTALRVRDELKSRTERYRELTIQLRSAEREHDVHKKLDDLLGQNGLQRELVRDAEQQIVALANDTLQNLSDGELSLEQDDEAAGRDDKAFALRVRRAGDPFPIGVLFLSGSQKFRVAVSIALAVGRFASGRARPLEAVIIDEGFGSLDKDGLRAMADELKRLQRSQALKRIVLVSHQDEFTDQFPVGYRLHPCDDGTTAAPFRR